MLLDRSAKALRHPKSYRFILRDSVALRFRRPCGTIFASAGTTAILPDKIGDNNSSVC
jgi:hypothetical protein